MQILKNIFFCLVALLLAAACKRSPEAPKSPGAFTAAGAGEDPYTYEEIQESGELIVATISGPDTYFEYQGRGMGLQFAYAEAYAVAEGLRLRVELAQDTLALYEMLRRGDADIAALQLPKTLSEKHGARAAGVTDKQGQTAWAVAISNDQLAQALNEWFTHADAPDIKEKADNQIAKRTQVKRHVKAPYISREKGIISIYDDQFKKAAAHVGWDWRLIAAQCYQESGFDANAVSWAGACGLMQLMPATAESVGLPEDKIYSPNENIAAGARYLKRLASNLSDIQSAAERIKFTLACYNAGPGHIADARALARKHGRNDAVWDNVAPYVLGLSQPRFYRDPVVRHGYMIGAETVNYVASVVSRWQSYGGVVSSASPAPAALPTADKPARKPNRFSRPEKVLSPEELMKKE